MKKNIVISLIGLLLACVSCDFYTSFILKNNSSQSMVGFFCRDDRFFDNSVPMSDQLIIHPGDSIWDVVPGLASEFFYGSEKIYYFELDTINKYGLKEANAKGLFYQRYEVTYHDYEKMKGYFPVPPTPEMSDIRMWPPYGTYK